MRVPRRFNIGDIVISVKMEDHRRNGKLFKVVSGICADSLKVEYWGDGTMIDVQEIPNGEIEHGFYHYRFEPFDPENTHKCKYCISQCKREEACDFFIPVWEEGR